MSNKIIRERIAHLFGQAEENAKLHPERAVRYVGLARRLSTRYRVSIPQRFKRRACKKCNRFLIPGYNVRIRINQRNKLVEYICDCGAVRRFGYKRMKKER